MLEPVRLPPKSGVMVSAEGQVRATQSQLRSRKQRPGRGKEFSTK